MQTFAIAHNQWEALNTKGAPKPQTDFAATLSQATGAKRQTGLSERPTLLPLNQDDFAGGDAALPAASVRQFKALSAQDFGAKPRANLLPLTTADYVPGAKAASDDPDSQVRPQVEKWVGETFYGNLLKQMHDDPFKSDLFDGGRGAQAFEPLFDQHIADHIAQGHSNKLVESIVQDIESKMKKRATQSPSQDHGSPMPARINPYWNEKAHVPTSIRA